MNPGLQNIKLQDGYKKLLVSSGDSGIDLGMTKISTSQGDAIAASVLYMGADGDEGASGQSLLKIKPTQAAGNRFFSITNYAGSPVTFSEENEILGFRSHGTDALGRGVWGGRCQIDYHNNGMIEFVNGSSISTLQSYPTIKRHTGGNVFFEVGTSDPTAYFQFDRLKIGNDAASNNNTASFDATGVDFNAGKIEVDGLYVNTDMSTSAYDIDLQPNGDVYLEASDVYLKAGVADTFSISGAQDIYIEALAGAQGNEPDVYIDAWQEVSSGYDSQVRIGTQYTGTKDFSHDGNLTGGFGTSKVVIGNMTRTDSELELNSRSILLENSMIISKLSDSATWDDGWDSSLVSGSYASWYSEDDGSQGWPWFYDGKTTTKYKFELLEDGKARNWYFQNVDATATDTTIKEPAADGECTQYVQNGKMIFKYNNGASYDYFYFDLTDQTAGGQNVLYSASDPA